MKHEIPHWLRRTVAVATALCSLPIVSLTASAVESVPDFPMTSTTWKQNGDHLSPQVESADGTLAELPITAADTTGEGLRRAENLPASFNLQDVDGESYVTSVKNQGTLGLCWAYAALGACESNIMMQGLDIPENWRDENGELNLSEGALGWYIYTNHMQNGDFTSGDYITMTDKGSGGGSAVIASSALAAGMGAQLEQDAPIGRWSSGYSEYLRFMSRYRMKHSNQIWDIETGSESLIQTWLMENGAVSASYYSEDDYFENDTSVAYYQKEYDTNDADHAILIVGWDDNYARTNFRPSCRPTQDGAWLVRNSWGDDDAYEGYFWISYEEPSLCEFTQFEMEEAKGNETCYQYDGAVSYMGLATESAANVFTAEEDGVITSVMFPSFFDNPQNVYYTVSLYALSERAETPTDGELLYSADGMTQYDGYKSIAIDAVPIQKGTEFSVVLQLRDRASKRGAKPLYVALESNDTETAAEPIWHGYLQAGQSFVSDEPDEWFDVKELTETQHPDGTYPYSDLGNVALKVVVDTSENAVNWTQLQEATAYGAPSSSASALYQNAYAEAEQLSADATQWEVDNVTKCLLAGLEQDRKLSYPHLLYANCTGWEQGDVDNDSIIAIQDAYLALLESSQSSAGGIGSLTPSQVMSADADQDEDIDISDAFYILMYSSYASAGQERTWDELLREFR